MKQQSINCRQIIGPEGFIPAAARTARGLPPAARTPGQCVKQRSAQGALEEETCQMAAAWQGSTRATVTVRFIWQLYTTGRPNSATSMDIQDS